MTQSHNLTMSDPDRSDSNSHSILIVGNGPSAAIPAAATLKDANTKILRTNWFFLEDKLIFGQKVDYYQIDFAETLLIHVLRQVIKSRCYTFDNIFFDFSAPQTNEKHLSVVQHYASIYRRYFADDFYQTLYEQYHCSLSPNADFQAIVDKINAEQKTPTSGIQALIKAAYMGFQDIRVAGVDFYADRDTGYGICPLPNHLNQHHLEHFKKHIHNKIRGILGLSLLDDNDWMSLQRKMRAHSLKMEITTIRNVLASCPKLQLTVFCTDKAAVIWKQIPNIRVLSAQSIQDNPPIPDNGFVHELNTIKLSEKQQQMIKNLLWIYLFKSWLLPIAKFIRASLPFPIYRLAYRTWNMLVFITIKILGLVSLKS